MMRDSNLTKKGQQSTLTRKLDATRLGPGQWIQSETVTHRLSGVCREVPRKKNTHLGLEPTTVRKGMLGEPS